MATEERLTENKAVVRRALETVVNAKNLAATQTYFALDVGRVLWILTALPDAHLTFDWQVAEGDQVASGITIAGTHAGEWEGIPPTGKPVTVTAILHDRVVDGKIIHHEAVIDLLSALQQVGARLVSIES